MVIKYFLTSIFLLSILKLDAQALNINEKYNCNQLNLDNLNQEQCTQSKQQNTLQIANANKEEEEEGNARVYKLRLRDAATGNFRQGNIFSPGDKDREEWIVVTVINNQQIKVRHATNIENKFWGTRQWYDHPALAIRICAVEQFDLNDCQTTQGDTVILPEGKTIHELQIDFKYSEGGALYTRSVQIPKDAKYK
jgi:hypothetical protein